MRIGLCAAGAALLLHGLLLTGLSKPFSATAHAPLRTPSMRVRALAPAAPSPEAAPAAALDPLRPSGATALRRMPMFARASGMAEFAQALPRPPPQSAPGPAAVRSVDPRVAEGDQAAFANATVEPSFEAAGSNPPAGVPNPASPAQPAVSATLTLPEGEESIPVYSTAFAPSQILVYRLKRGILSGTAELSWHHALAGAEASYELELVARVAGVTLLAQTSRGSIDAAGLSPQRHTDQRLRGSVRATNFQRERGVIAFSGPSVEYPLVPGVQDRLSWMLQLPAIVEAAPQRARLGERITLAVVGTRGDAAVWVFRFETIEPVTTEAGDVSALKFVREPRKAHDTRAEVWLDPARNHLPVRARIGNPPDGDALDLVLSAR